MTQQDKVIGAIVGAALCLCVFGICFFSVLYLASIEKEDNGWIDNKKKKKK